ncbi:hypothetical protein JCM8097_000849 [Rhodosporidiobolus ruineniae]
MIGLALVALLLVLLGAGHDEEARIRTAEWARWRPSWGSREEVEAGYARPSREELRRMVGEAPKYLVKDGWACYGYNNQRYMLETTLLLARLANRIPIIPDAIWARSCAVDSSTCRENALRFFEHGNAHPEALSCKWNDDGEVYKLGIENFLDLPHLRRSYGPFLTFSEFFDLHSLPQPVDQTQVWNAPLYTPERMSAATVEEGEFQNRTFVRVDKEPSELEEEEEGAEKLDREKVEKALGARTVWNLPLARDALNKGGVDVAKLDDEAMVQRLEQVGVVPLFTFSDEVLMNKALSRPSIELALPSRTQSFSSLLSSPPYSSNVDILYLRGNLHDQRKPGGLYFSTAAAREGFRAMVLRGVRAPEGVRRAGEELARRMEEKVGGRRWVAAHLRRGDFVDIAWSPSKDPVVHFNETKVALAKGVEEVKKHYSDRLPLPDDPFYLATDESNATSLAYYRQHGALLLTDLLHPSPSSSSPSSPSDNSPYSDPLLTAHLGPSAAYTDVLGLVEQQILARASFFVGSELSSTTGGAVNVRLSLKGESEGEWGWRVVKKHED